MLIFSFNYAWIKLHNESTNKDSYRVDKMKLRLLELQVEEHEVRKVKTGLESLY